MSTESLHDLFKEAYDSYADAIFRFCIMKTSSEDVAADLMQETFTRYWLSLKDGKEMSNARAYLYTIAGNLVIDWYRKKKSDSLDRAVEAGHEPADPHREGVGDPLREAEHEELWRVLEVLPEAERELILWRFVEGIEPREIADQLGISANAASVRIDRALKRLKAQLHA